MSFLRRVFAGSPSASADGWSKAGYVSMTGPAVVGPNGFVYGMTTCPHCGTTLDPLPSKKGPCRTCGEPIVYAKTPDGIRVLHRPDNDIGLAAEEALVMTAEMEYTGQRPVRPHRLQQVRRDQLSRAASLGLSVRIVGREEEPKLCDPCAALDGKVFAASAAPVLPLSGCRSKFACNCEYVLQLT